MSVKYIDDYHSNLSSSPVGKSLDDFERNGHPGKWLKSITCTGTAEFNFTGSNYGAGGIIIGTAGQTIHLSGGGTIPSSDLTTDTIHELSISKVVSTGSGTSYVLLRNQLIR